MKRIYVLCPYSGSTREQEYRFNIVSKYTGDLIKQGHIAFSPITHCHPIAQISGLPGDFDFWLRFNEEFISWSEEGHVLCLPGWNTSTGINGELKMFKEQRKPVLFVNPDGTINEQAVR